MIRIGRVKRWDKFALVVVLLFSFGALSAALFYLGKPIAAKLLTTHGLALTIAGLLQLEVSGLLENIMDRFSDEKEYPYGPPSHIMREIYNDPDSSISGFIENLLFYKPRTGFWLIVLGTAAQILGAWL
jgi:TM2 domain-containing membrane protein YozV